MTLNIIILKTRMTTCISSEVSCRADGTDRLTDKTGKGNYSFAKKIKLLVP